MRRSPLVASLGVASLLLVSPGAVRLARAEGTPPPAAPGDPPVPPPPGPPAPSVNYYAPPGTYAPPPAPGTYSPPPALFQPPRPTRYEEQPRWGLFTTGAVLFGAVYGFNVLIPGYVLDEPRFFIPVVGPISYIPEYRKRFDCNPTRENYYYCATESSGDRMFYVTLVLDALAQATGVGLLVYGLASRHRVAVFDAPSVTIVPSVTPGGAGLAAIGRF